MDMPENMAMSVLNFLAFTLIALSSQVGLRIILQYTVWLLVTLKPILHYWLFLGEQCFFLFEHD